MKVGMGQLLVEGGEPERNFTRAQDLIKEAAQKSCDIILLPECLDLAWTHPSALSEAQPIPGIYSDRLCDLAQKFHIYICAGLTEKDNNAVYNTAVFIDDSGNILLKYRKINALKVELPFYGIGQTLSVVDTRFGKIGVNICADNYADSLVIGHTLARMGAQLILSPSSWTVEHGIDETQDPYKEKWLKPFLTLAKLYDLVIVGATSVGYIVGGPYEGKKMVGCSLAVDKMGILAKGPFLEFAGELVTCEFKLTERKYHGTEIADSLRDRGYQLIWTID
ncbi:MAG: carbon-nitrogen hydrolase family protein [Deltaproteobacteria bacterium]|nr:carbon-nitrogen hydrolase family protein [Deltaproteobacteria bacterium]